jgi:hypothetical protein
MNIKITRILLAVFASCCLTHAVEVDSGWKKENPDWNMTSEVFTNPPYWLMPTNIPYELYPLINGKWVWTTNMRATWFGNTIENGVDTKKKLQVRRQWEIEQRKKWFASIPPGLAYVQEYHGRWNTNALENWGWGVWVEDTNTGWRVNLCPDRSNKIDKAVIIRVGSMVTNSGAGLLPPPGGKYARLQLMDANGKVVSPKKGAALKLYEVYPEFAPPPTREQRNEYFISPNPPSAWDASVERDYPEILSDLEYPRWRVNAFARQAGSFIRFVGFVSNGPPCQIGYVDFSELYAIKTKGDYTLTVQPVLYRQHFEGGTFQGYLDRVDLPSVTTKVHLVPNVN